MNHNLVKWLQIDRSKYSFTEDDETVMRSWLVLRGWRQQISVDKDCYSHERYGGHFPIFDWPEAVLKQVIYEAHKQTD